MYNVFVPLLGSVAVIGATLVIFMLMEIYKEYKKEKSNNK